MQKWWQWITRSWLRKHSLFEYFVVWHLTQLHLYRNSNRAREKGKEHLEVAAAEKYVDDKIKSDFAGAKAAISGNIRHEKELLLGRIGPLQAEVTELIFDLSEESKGGIIGDLHKDVAAAKLAIQQQGSLFFPETQLEEYLSEDYKEYKKELHSIKDDPLNDANILMQGVRRKLVFHFIDRSRSRFKQLRDSARAMIFNKRFPISKSVYRSSYAFCFLFVFCEMFISRKVLMGKANAFIQLTSSSTANNIIYEIIILAYAGGISVFLAGLYTMVFEIRGYLQKMGLFVLFCSLAAFMSYFFSRSHLPDNSTQYFHPTGIMFGILSAGFALANAWYYRQASYQEDLYKKTFPGRSIKYCERRIKKEKRRLGRRLRIKRRKLKQLEAMLRAFDVVSDAALNEYMKDLEASYIAEFWHGFNKQLNEIIENNNEVNIAILKQIKEKMHHYEKDQPIPDSHSNGVHQPGMSAR